MEDKYNKLREWSVEPRGMPTKRAEEDQLESLLNKHEDLEGKWTYYDDLSIKCRDKFYVLDDGSQPLTAFFHSYLLLLEAFYSCLKKFYSFRDLNVRNKIIKLRGYENGIL